MIGGGVQEIAFFTGSASVCWRAGSTHETVIGTATARVGRSGGFSRLYVKTLHTSCTVSVGRASCTVRNPTTVANVSTSIDILTCYASHTSISTTCQTCIATRNTCWNLTLVCCLV